MIKLTYGIKQQFRFRHGDINILGSSDAELPFKKSVYSLNGGQSIHFYVEPHVPAEKGPYPYGAKTPSVMRLADRPGHFNVEIPTISEGLLEGWNNVSLTILDNQGKRQELDLEFHWDPSPVSLPLDLSDVSRFNHIQEIAQVVNGDFEVVPQQNLIRSIAPVGTDVLLLLGSPHESQEATYDVRFTGDLTKAVFVGVSDFFVGHEEQSSDLGIKPGYSTVGLVTIRPIGWVEVWIMLGDLLMNKDWNYEAKTLGPPKISIEPNITYSARHQLIMKDGLVCVRFRLWRKDTPEPKKWTVTENNAHVKKEFRIPVRASFGLVQYWGSPTEWSNISVKVLNEDIDKLKLRRKKGYLIRALRTVKHRGAQLYRRVLASQD